MIRYLVITALALILISPSLAQATLEITIKDCREKKSWPFLAELNIYKNDSLYQSLEPTHENNLVIKDLTTGNYRIEYPSIFKNTECVDVEITKEKTYSTDICVDYLDYDSETYVPIIDRLNDGEKYTIEAASSGCFHQSNKSISIERKAGNFYLQNGKKKKPLDSSDILALRHFEWELNYMQSFGCTTTDTYTLSYKKEKLQITDGSCDWFGHRYLFDELNVHSDE